MRVTTLDAHVGGAAVRLVTSGLPALAGASMADRRASFDAVASDIAQCLSREPRGHAGLVGVVLTEADRGEADAGLLFFTGAGPRRLSGHAAIAAVALALDHRLITPRRADVVSLDTEIGPIAITVVERDVTKGARRLRLEGPPAMVVRGNVRVTAARRAIKADLAWSGTEVVAIIDGEAVGVPLSLAHTLELRRTATEILANLNEAVTLTLPDSSAPAEITACAFVGPASDVHADIRSVLIRADGTVSRSPSASGTAAVSVVLVAMGLQSPGARSRHESLSGTSWIAEATPLQGDLAGPVAVAITAEVSPTGSHEFVLVAGDPLPLGAPWM
jgi:proline racemase